MIRRESQGEKKSSSRSQKANSHGKLEEICHLVPGAKEVYLAGEFNSWDPQSMPMKRGKDGIWKARTKPHPGRYEYKLMADEVWIEDLADTEKTGNPFGTKNFAVRGE